MKIKWYGHASFLIETKGKKIVTDPYVPNAFGGSITYGPIPDVVDIALVSHDHDDHAGVKYLKGNPMVIKEGEKSVEGIKIKGISSYHDSSRGRDRGPNTIFVIESEGLRVCHLGDLGHVLTEDQIKEIGDVDILFIPVGGTYTIDARDADEVVSQLKPRIVIPMHYKTPKCNFPISGVDSFVMNKKNVKRLAKSEVEISKENLPDRQEIWVLEYAM